MIRRQRGVRRRWSWAAAESSIPATVAAVILASGLVAHADAPTATPPPDRDAVMAPAPTDAESTTISITALQPRLTLGIDSGTTLVITVVGPLAGRASPGRTQASVGVIGPLLASSAPGSFTAEYSVPADHMPQSAIVSAEVSLPGGERIHAATRLLLPAATRFPLRTSPNALVSLEIAGQLFGPQRADSAGNVEIPIVVPPHVGSGRARAVNRFGITNETDVDLQPRDYPRVLVIAPPAAEAGGTVDVEVWAVDPSGEPSPPEDIDLHASGGSVRRVGGMPGSARFAFKLPGQVGAGAVSLVAAMDDGTSVRSEVMMVRAGAPSEILISSNLKRLVVGSGSRASLTLAAQDRFGNAVAVDGISLTADGNPLPLAVGAGEAHTELGAPAAWSGRDHVALEAALGPLRAATDLLITGGSPARAALMASRPSIEGDDVHGVEFVLELFDSRGTPTSGTRVIWQTDDDGTLETLPSAHFGRYAVRFIPSRTLRDHAALITVTVDSGLQAKGTVVVEAGTTRAAAARIGVMSNLGGSYGQSAFLEATVPLPRLGHMGRFLSAGLTAGYLHSQVNISAGGALFPPVQLNVNQVPILALGRVRIPGQLPVVFSLSATAGMTFAATSVVPDFSDEGSPLASTHGSAHALVLGGGVDASILLLPGELVIGAHYLHARLGRNSNGDRIEGNALGFMADLGFRMGF